MKERWEILSSLVNINNYKVVAEIGVNRGINAANWIALCPSIEKAYLIDIPTNTVFDKGLFWDKNVLHKIEYLPVGSEEASKIVPDTLDIVFIDADHSYEGVSRDIQLWLPKIRKGGIISGHDWTDRREIRDGISLGVKEAVINLIGEINLESDILEQGEIKVWWKYV